jgi:hypothetical protein
MQSVEWQGMLRLVPEAERTKLVIVLVNGTELCVDTIIRYEEAFVVMRGRVGGQVEEARGFFVPYDQMLYLRLDRVMKVEELQAFFSAPPTPEQSATNPDRVPEVPAIDAPAPPPVPTDPATASRLLVERIRAARANLAARFPSSTG